MFVKYHACFTVDFNEWFTVPSVNNTIYYVTKNESSTFDECGSACSQFGTSASTALLNKTLLTELSSLNASFLTDHYYYMTRNNTGNCLMIVGGEGGKAAFMDHLPCITGHCFCQRVIQPSVLLTPATTTRNLTTTPATTARNSTTNTASKSYSSPATQSTTTVSTPTLFTTTVSTPTIQRTTTHFATTVFPAATSLTVKSLAATTTHRPSTIVATTCSSSATLVASAVPTSSASASVPSSKSSGKTY
ncbi:hypothetical protein DPMN_071819 [Dreissena polymorpha]|uniref:Uncharacterized protein n=1 Tax=Dreissena polymorpha TaxID=45954 RepID=A0A9D3Z3D6_DREPO|nr:hypothetical protein DPMN_071819 [Dreissena polymorpha]